MYIFELLKRAFTVRDKAGIDAGFLDLLPNGIASLLPARWDVPAPKTVYWTINSVCNLRCRMCDVGMFNEDGMFFRTLRIDRKLHEIEIDVFRRVIDELRLHRPFIAINGTEPTLYKPLAEAVAYCVQSGLRCGVTTGGYRLADVADDLADAGLHRLNVSIDGPPDVHNAIRGRDDSFQRSIAGIRRFAERARHAGAKPQIILDFTISNLNYHAIADFLLSVDDVPFDHANLTYMWTLTNEMAKLQNARFGHLYPVTASCNGPDSDPGRVDVELLSQQLDEVARDPRVRIQPSRFDRRGLTRYFHHLDELMMTDARCVVPWFITQILADGRVIAHTRCHNQPVGNIHEAPLLEIWNGPAMKTWRAFLQKEKLMPMCGRCDGAY